MTSTILHPSTVQTQATSEVRTKLEWMRQALSETGAGAIRLRGIDWFSWATAGASNVVLLSAESGIADVLVTMEGAWILTDEIEASRLRDEELPGIAEYYPLQVHPWAEVEKREAFVHDRAEGKPVLSDRPTSNESPLPISLVNHKRTLLPEELNRYRQVGQLASEAMTEVLTQARPDWTEYQLAGAGAEALWKRGLHPALTLVAGERRLPLYRHAIATKEPIGNIAMLVFCARGYGLYANLTRFVAFNSLSSEQEILHQQVREIEAVALDRCKIGTSLDQIYTSLKQTYEQQGHPQAIAQHHQGGTTGYLAREIIATPGATSQLAANTAIALNPSLVGTKIEDTFVLLEDNTLENLTCDRHWPHTEVNGRLRPLPLVLP